MPGSSADACLSTPLSPGLVCNCWLRRAPCPEQSQVSLSEAGRATPCAQVLLADVAGQGPCCQPVPAEVPAPSPPCADWSRGRSGRREQGPGSSSGPRVSGGAPPAGPGFTQLLLWAQDRPTELLARRSDGKQGLCECSHFSPPSLSPTLCSDTLFPCCFSFLKP